jgi:Zn-finger nucleic acid-binding protein
MRFMNAETLNCPMCGAATSTDEPLCKYCGARLATIACASCFGMMFLGSKHCPRCGAAAAKRESGSLPPLSCPRCRSEMQALTIGSTTVRECERCSGLWVDVPSFEKICADREQQGAVLGTASPAPQGQVTERGTVRYAPCPQCAQLMNRINFARCSGVIVDICKGHGSWFDRDELTRIVEFIRAGGLDAARAREKTAIQEERRQLRQAQRSKGGSGSALLDIDGADERDVGITSGIASARGLLKLLLD